MIAKIAMRDLIWSDVPLRAVCMLVSLNALNNFICILYPCLSCAYARYSWTECQEMQPLIRDLLGLGCLDMDADPVVFCLFVWLVVCLFACLLACLFVCLVWLHRPRFVHFFRYYPKSTIRN